MAQSNKIKRLRRTLRAKRRHLHIYKCKVCGGLLRDSDYLDHCNACHKPDTQECLVCGVSIEGDKMVCNRCSQVSGVKKKVRRRCLRKVNKGNVSVLVVGKRRLFN